MYEIKEVYKTNYMRDRTGFVGTLRNEKRFKIDDYVFFAIDGYEIARGRIIGVESELTYNPSYIYKILLPEDVSNCRFSSNFVKLTCRDMFNTVEEARDSAEKELDKMYELQKKELKSYFDQFDKIK